MSTLFRVVVDTNILLRGLLNMQSAAGRVVSACDQRLVVMLLNKPVISEYRFILTDPAITERYPELTAEKVEIALRRLRYVGHMVRSTLTKFQLPRDPRDAKFVELAIAGRATHIVSGDNDLLSLGEGRTEAAKRLRQRAPSLQILDAGSFLNELESSAS